MNVRVSANKKSTAPTAVDTSPSAERSINDTVDLLRALFAAHERGAKSVGNRSLSQTLETIASNVTGLMNRDAAYEALLIQLESAGMVDGDGNLFQADPIFSGDFATWILCTDRHGDRCDFAAAAAPCLSAVMRCIRIAADAQDPEQTSDQPTMISDALNGAEILSSFIGALLARRPVGRAPS